MDQRASDEDVSAANNDGREYNSGYEEESSDSPNNETFESPTEEDITAQPASISEEDARQAFLELANKHCCYSSTPAEEMTIDKMEGFTAYRYSLYSFIEERTTYWKTNAYYGEEVDGSFNGPSPGRWNIQVNCPEWFKENKCYVTVPHTSEVKNCSDCGGDGKKVCPSCDGKKKRDCMACFGTGETFQGNMCYSCGGRGETICFTCTAQGKIKCSNCSGQGKVITFLEMKVKWINLEPCFVHVMDNAAEFPADRFCKVSGEVVILDEDNLVEPLTTFHDQSINEASQESLEQHAVELPENSRIVRQMQQVESLPLSKVHYTWGGKQGEYFVYGEENKAYCDNYPQKCCCCAIM
ncbi:protein SSUH2 homolog [Dendrobates tinctorius]|uniref:protein SSUH2 homolog n=1 Tax=Dendrobates tinctorius TaxID=92724 RepID=UPI003CC93D03